MKSSRLYIGVVLILLCPIIVFGLVVGFNRSPLGPEIEDKRPYYGCYSYNSKPILMINQNVIKDLIRGDKTRLLRIFYIKNDVVIDTERELLFDSIDNSVRIKDYPSKLIYSFKKHSRIKTLLLYDSDYNVYELERGIC